MSAHYLPSPSDEPAFMATALECGFFPDEPRRIEPDAAFIPEDDTDPNTDEHGWVMRPGTAPFYGGLA